MIKLADLALPNEKYYYSLSKLIGKKIKDIHGWIDDEGDEGLVFRIAQVEFEDGSLMSIEYRGGFPYMAEFELYPQPNYDKETLLSLYQEQNSDE